MASSLIETTFPVAESAESQSALCWRAHGQEEAILLCLHGIQTHAGWFELLGEEMATRHTTTYALNRRGSGPNGASRWRGDIDDWHRWIDDIRTAATEIQKRHPGVPLYLVGVSWGAKTALGTLIASDAKLFDGSVLIAPALATTKDPNIITRGLQKLVSAVRPASRVDLTKRLTADDYTKCVDTQNEWLNAEDTGLLRSVTQRFLSQSAAQFKETKRNIAKVPVPVLVLFGTGDELVNRYDSDQILRPLRQDPPPPFGQAKLTTLLLTKLTHASIVEAPQQLAKLIHKWIEARRGSPQPANEFWLPAYATAHGIDAKTGKCTASKADLRKKAHGIAATGIKVKTGEELRIRWDSSIWWQDAGLTPVPAGGSAKEHWAQKCGRHWLLLKKNQDGTPAAYFTVLAHVKQEDGGRVTTEVGFAKDSWTEEVVWKAPASGELYLSANDSTMLSPSVIFTNNTGTLRLTITR
ncbi:MAG: alpha/beta fold hydrolase [Verrucomicrobiales bacterium]|nr:alpha/beta fold hydrolase [Verrucomicrobiales bacterium]MCP5559593.1 alpha/beta fold hydrolase [Verrucomicrobiaceae bacterium]